MEAGKRIQLNGSIGFSWTWLVMLHVSELKKMICMRENVHYSYRHHIFCFVISFFSIVLSSLMWLKFKCQPVCLVTLIRPLCIYSLCYCALYKKIWLVLNFSINEISSPCSLCTALFGRKTCFLQNYLVIKPRIMILMCAQMMIAVQKLMFLKGM